MLEGDWPIEECTNVFSFRNITPTQFILFFSLRPPSFFYSPQRFKCFSLKTSSLSLMFTLAVKKDDEWEVSNSFLLLGCKVSKSFLVTIKHEHFVEQQASFGMFAIELKTYITSHGEKDYKWYLKYLSQTCRAATHFSWSCSLLLKIHIVVYALVRNRFEVSRKCG